MADVSIMSMIAGFLPASSDPAPLHSPTVASTKPPTGAAAEGSSGRGRAATSRRAVHMICFSKNRAFQLDQLLHSSKRHLKLVQDKVGGGAGEGQEPAQFRVSVLYVASAAPLPDAVGGTARGLADAEELVAATRPAAAPSLSGNGRAMEESYDIVRRRHPDVRFVQERPGGFCDQLCSLVREETGDQAPRSTEHNHESGVESFVLFAVDDMFFYRDFELPGALELLATDPSTFCVHLRLHPGITWSHTSGAPCHVPPLSPSGREVTPSQGPLTRHHGSGSEVTNDARHSAGEKVSGASENDETREKERQAVLVAEFGLLTFAREEGTGEWDYPWDLTGGLYRREDAVAVVGGIVSTFGKQAAANPNLLEYHGHALLRRKDNLQPTGTDDARGSAETSGRDTALGGQASAGVLRSSSSKPSCLHASAETAATGSASAGGASSASSPPEKPQLPAPRVDLDSAATSSGPLGTGAVSVAGAALSAAVNAAKAAPRCGCSGRAVVSSIAVNRVQSTYSTPVYASQGGGIGDLDRRLGVSYRPVSSGAATGGKLAGAVGGGPRESVTAGGEGRAEGTQNGKGDHGGAGEGEERDVERGGLDGHAYRRRVFDSVHVGELWFEAEESGVATTAEMVARRGRHAEVESTNSGTSGRNEQQRSHANTVTVLLPVRNGGDHLVDAVESVISCAREMPSGWGVDLLIVDDGSEDGAVERAVAAVTHADTTVVGSERDPNGDRDQPEPGGGPEGWSIDACGAGPGKERCTKVEEYVVERSDSAADDGSVGGGGVFASSGVVPHGVGGGSCPTMSETRRTQSRVAVRVLRHERSVGLAESLNEGLREARSDLVARMDADDVCMPGRLKQQVAFMLEHPRVSVLGTSVVTFSGKTTREGSNGTRIKEHQPPLRDTAVHLPVSGVQRIARHPTGTTFLAWSMLFGCCLSHPSVMLRRDRVVEVGGYDPTAEPAEDYDLWLRMQSSDPGCVANLGEVLLGLRKHGQNVSRQRRLEQGVAADAAAARTMTRLLTGQVPRREVTPALAAAVRRPETVASAGDLADAARLLGDLGAVAVATETVEPRRAAGIDTRTMAKKVVGRNPNMGISCNAVDDLHEGEGGKHRLEQQRRGRDMIARDIEARLGAMGVHAMGRFGAGAAPVLDEWRKRFPDRPLLFALGGGR